MKAEKFIFSGFGGKPLNAMLWQPEGETKQILQITHGMTEHIGRYTRLAEYLTDRGIAVAGFDLRGHGENEGKSQVASFGEGGWEASIEDMHLFYALLEEKIPGLPHYMHGFSLGSFLLREYLGKYPENVAGAVILGTGHQPKWLLKLMIALVNGEIKKAGFDQTTSLIDTLSFGTYNQKFKPNRTTADWICADEAQTDIYLADSLVRKKISAGLFRQLLESMLKTGMESAYSSWRKDMPILLISGECDPVGNNGKGVRSLKKLLDQAGLSNIDFRLMSNCRHDLLHEEAGGAAGQTRKAIADWVLS